MVPAPSESSMAVSSSELAPLLSDLQSTILSTYLPPTSSPILPPAAVLQAASSTLLQSLPTTGLGIAPLTSHLLTDLLPAFNASSTSPHYYGFVTGGVTPAALLADILVSLADQNVQVHLPTDTLSTKIEDVTLSMLLELFHLEKTEWLGRTFTTGGTASNILGLACGREHLLQDALKRAGYSDAEASTGDLGILAACIDAGITGIQVLSAAPHSSITKAASIVGIGRKQVHDISWSDTPWEFDLEELEERLKSGQERGIVSIVVVGFGEVNTGRFTTGLGEIRRLLDEYGGWLHVDAAFGIFARVLVGAEEAMVEVAGWAEGIELADSIAGDGHKLLNVPYDCGFFFTRTPALLQSTFVNTAPYLATPPSTLNSIPSPLNIGLENSRRFRALPVYATLAAYGSLGYRALVTRLVLHARGIARHIHHHPAYELLPVEKDAEDEETLIRKVFMVVLFRAKEEKINKSLKESINATGKIYVSGTMWDGREAVRVAVGNWRIEDGEQGWEVVREVLEEVLA